MTHEVLTETGQKNTDPHGALALGSRFILSTYGMIGVQMNYLN